MPDSLAIRWRPRPRAANCARNSSGLFMTSILTRQPIYCSRKIDSLLLNIARLSAMTTKPLVPTKFTIARNVEALRKHHGWSQHVLAQKSGVSQSTISNIESPERATPRYSPTTDNVDAVAAVFGVSSSILSMPLPLELLLDFGKASHLLETYASATPNERQAIDAVASITGHHHAAPNNRH